MSEKKVIKVVKREERKTQQNTGRKVKSAGETAQQAARDMVATVTNWVSEFQQKRRAETSQARALLANDPA